jgi:DoxX-like family
MQKIKILYWTVTSIFSAIFATTGTLYLLHSPRFTCRLHDLGYPLYVLNIIGVAKLLGVMALLTPKFPRLKEWAYAGFVIDFVGGIWSHLAVQGVSDALPLFLPLSILATSYISYRILQSNPNTAVAK